MLSVGLANPQGRLQGECRIESADCEAHSLRVNFTKSYTDVSQVKSISDGTDRSTSSDEGRYGAPDPISALCVIIFITLAIKLP
jgi:hypothetical protein